MLENNTDFDGQVPGIGVARRSGNQSLAFGFNPTIQQVSQEDSPQVSQEDSPQELPGVTNAEPLVNIFKQAMANANPSAPASSNQPRFEDSPYYEQAVRYASPDLDNNDYTPGFQQGAIVGSATNQTLGTFPLFSSAVIAPFGIWDKKRKAVGEYIANLEAAKASAGPAYGKGPTPEYIKSDENWERALNENITEDAQQFQQDAYSMKIPIAGADKLDHPLYPVFSSFMNKGKGDAALLSGLKANVAKTQELGLSADNHVGKIANQAINQWNQFSSLPLEEKKQLLRSQSFIDYMNDANKKLSATQSLYGLGSKILKDIETKSIQEANVIPGADYNTIVTKKLESKYPIGRDEEGQLVLSEEPYIKKLTKDIAGNNPSLFQDYDPENLNPDAPFKLEDLEERIANTLGYDRSTTKFISSAGKSGGGGSEYDKTDAFPQYAFGVAEKISRGEVAQSKDGKGKVIPGADAATFIINGVTTVVPYSNKEELVKKFAEMGGNSGDYGTIDASTAISNALRNVDLFKKISSKVSSRRPSVGSGSFAGQFNDAVYAASGSHGLPIVKGYSVKKVETLKGDTDEEFFFKASPDGATSDISGVFVPSNTIKSTVTKEGIFGAIGDAISGKSFAPLKEWSDDKSRGLSEKKIPIYTSVGSDMTMLGDAYYHKNVKGDDGYSESQETYTVYDKKTKAPAKFKDADNKEYSITLPEWQVKKITGEPTSLIRKSDESYPSSMDNEVPSGFQTTYSQNVGTKAGTDAGVLTTTGQYTDDDIRVASRLVENGYSYDKALKIASNARTSSNVKDKNEYANALKIAKNVNVQDLKKQWQLK